MRSVWRRVLSFTVCEAQPADAWVEDVEAAKAALRLLSTGSGPAASAAMGALHTVEQLASGLFFDGAEWIESDTTTPCACEASLPRLLRDHASDIRAALAMDAGHPSDLRTPGWFNLATDEAIYPDLLKKARHDGRITGYKTSPKRFAYSIAEVEKHWPEHAGQIAKYNREQSGRDATGRNT